MFLLHGDRHSKYSNHCNEAWWYLADEYLTILHVCILEIRTLVFTKNEIFVTHLPRNHPTQLQKPYPQQPKIKSQQRTKIPSARQKKNGSRREREREKSRTALFLSLVGYRNPGRIDDCGSVMKLSFSRSLSSRASRASYIKTRARARYRELALVIEPVKMRKELFQAQPRAEAWHLAESSRVILLCVRCGRIFDTASEARKLVLPAGCFIALERGCGKIKHCKKSTWNNFETFLLAIPA